MEAEKIRIIRSSRKTTSVELWPDELVLRVPLRYTDEMVQELLLRNKTWIEKQQAKIEQRRLKNASVVPLTKAELQELTARAKEYLPGRVRYYAPLIGVSYGKITIRHQKTKWGSCSSKGNLNFNCLLMLMPPEIIDSVVVHELCHRKEMNHSDKFYREILKVFPSYESCRKWLNEHGAEYMSRLQV